VTTTAEVTGWERLAAHVVGPFYAADPIACATTWCVIGQDGDRHGP
jgi:hypothetical protein